jgi:hypothetical protein
MLFVGWADTPSAHLTDNVLILLEVSPGSLPILLPIHDQSRWLACWPLRPAIAPAASPMAAQGIAKKDGSMSRGSSRQSSLST